MNIKYREKMKEYKVVIDDPVLDPAFVSKAKAFEEKLKGNQLTDDEIKAADEELLKDFEELHSLEEDEAEEVKEANHKKDVAEAKVEITEAGELELLLSLKTKFKDLPEVLPLIDKKVEKLEKIKADEEDVAKDNEIKFSQGAQKEISEASFESLQELIGKYKDYPILVESINKRIAEEKTGHEEKTLKETLLAKKEWSYANLRALGVEPTGNDMTVAGVRLEKEYLFAIYSVRK
jgi:hypothetical protein